MVIEEESALSNCQNLQPVSITCRLGAAQIKCLEQLSWLSRILLESKFSDVFGKGVFAASEDLSETIGVVESGGVQLENVRVVHFGDVFLLQFQLSFVQLEGLAGKVRPLDQELVSLSILLRFEELIDISTRRLNHAPHDQKLFNV